MASGLYQIILGSGGNLGSQSSRLQGDEVHGQWLTQDCILGAPWARDVLLCWGVQKALH